MYTLREREKNRLLKVIEDIKTNIQNLKRLTYNYEENHTSKLIMAFEDKIKENEKSIKELEYPFMLAVVGCGNYGKSTLINLLLQDNIINTSVLPNTWKIDVFVNSPMESGKIIYEDKEEVRTLKNIEKILEKEEEKIKINKRKINNEIQSYKKNNKPTIEELNIFKQNIEKENYKPNIKEIRYLIKDKPILRNFTLIDTPGLNQTLLKNTKERMIDYYIKSDGILLLMDAQNISAKNNYDFLETVETLDGKNTKGIIAIVNKMDLINLEDRKKLIDKVEEIYKDKFIDTIFISAKDAISGKDEVSKKRLLEAINKKFKNICDKSQIEAKYKNMYIMKAQMLKEIYNYKRKFYKDLSDYQHILFEIDRKTKEEHSAKLSEREYNLLLQSICEYLANISQVKCNKLYKVNISNNLPSEAFIEEQNKINIDFKIALAKDFEDRYVEYSSHKKHLEYINNIEKILENLR